jgi:cellulose synthase/poly-beta-1,6-N-acetylglucosamine synthase-like glycosyltransferase
LLSVIIPCQEDGSLLFPTLKSIFSNTFPAKNFEVLLICDENNYVSKRVSSFPIQQYQIASRSQARALNYGLEKAKGDPICITKPGVIVSSDWLDTIARFFERSPDVHGMGGPVWPCWENGAKIQKLASQIFYEEQGFPDSKTMTKLGHYQTYLHSTNSAYRKDSLKSLRFDASFIYDYDFDLCCRMLQTGRRLMYNPDMKVQYIFPSGLRDLIRRYYIWGKEKAILRKKYSPQTQMRSYFYGPYNTVRSFLLPSSHISTKKLLGFVQHMAYILGNVNGYGCKCESSAMKHLE